MIINYTWKTWILSGFFAAQCWPSCSLQQVQVVMVVAQQIQCGMKTIKFVQLSVCYQLDYVDTWLLQMGFNMVWYRADLTQINICFWKDYNMTISLVKPADTGLFSHWGKIMFHIRLVTTWGGFLFDMVKLSLKRQLFTEEHHDDHQASYFTSFPPSEIFKAPNTDRRPTLLPLASRPPPRSCWSTQSWPAS